MRRSEKKIVFLLTHGCHGRNFIQTIKFGKYFDSTMNVACQMPKWFASAVEKLLGLFSPQKNVLSKSIINFQNSEQIRTNCYVFHLVLMQ